MPVSFIKIDNKENKTIAKKHKGGNFFLVAIIRAIKPNDKKRGLSVWEIQETASTFIGWTRKTMAAINDMPLFRNL